MDFQTLIANDLANDERNKSGDRRSRGDVLAVLKNCNDFQTTANYLKVENCFDPIVNFFQRYTKNMKKNSMLLDLLVITHFCSLDPM